MFEFGKCKTDIKKGHKLHDRADFINDTPYAQIVEKALKLIGIPQPKEENIFRGSFHDMLFLNSHGVVVRIGYTNVRDLLNPGILQPLGWLEDKSRQLKKYNLPFCIAIYPGTELFTQYSNQAFRPPACAASIKEILSLTNQKLYDLHENNTGIMRVKIDDSKTIAAPLVIDIDNRFNGVCHQTDQHQQRLHIAQKSARHPGDIVHLALTEIFNNVAKLSSGLTPIDLLPWKKAFEMHAPLREKFWNSFDSDDIHTSIANPQQLSAFWTACRSCLNKKVEMAFPTWSCHKDQHDHIIFERSQTPAFIECSLYRPWTNKEADIPGKKASAFNW